MDTIRTFFMHVVVSAENEGALFIGEVLEPMQFNFQDEDQLVFIEMAADKLHGVTIHKGIRTSHYGQTAMLANRRVSLSIGTPLAHILADERLENTVYKAFFDYIQEALNNTSDDEDTEWLDPESFRQKLEEVLRKPESTPEPLN